MIKNLLFALLFTFYSNINYGMHLQKLTRHNTEAVLYAHSNNPEIDHLSDLPYELILHIANFLSIDEPDYLNFALINKHFFELLTNEKVIQNSIYPQIESILLNLIPPYLDKNIPPKLNPNIQYWAHRCLRLKFLSPDDAGSIYGALKYLHDDSEILEKIITGNNFFSKQDQEDTIPLGISRIANTIHEQSILPAGINTYFKNRIDFLEKTFHQLLEHIAKDDFKDLLKAALEKSYYIDYQSGTSLVNQAAELGCLKNLKNLVSQGASIHRGTYLGNTPILKAATSGHNKCLAFLIVSKADVNTENIYYDSPLTYAAGCGNKKCIKILLKNNANPNHQNEEGDTPSNIAAKASNYKSLKHLIKNKADINLPNNDGITPLHYAASSKNYKCLKLLLKNKALTNKLNKQKESALMIASKRGSLQCVQLLLDYGAQPEYPSKAEILP